MDISLDLETLSTNINAVVLSIGAVRFDPLATNVTLPPTESFFLKLNIDELLALGGEISAATLRFWVSDDAAAARQFAFAEDGEAGRLYKTLEEFSLFVSGAENVWSHGAAFDIPILQEWYHKIGVVWPFGYQAARDTRTLYGLCAPEVSKVEKPEGFVKHHPTWDAWLQARSIQNCYAALGKHAVA